MGTAPNKKPRRAIALLLWGLCWISLCARAASEGEQNLFGLLVLGHEVRSFQSCADHRTYWLQLDPKIREQVESNYRRLTRKPYEPLLTEATLEPSAGPVGEFARDFDGVRRLVAIRRVFPESACDALEVEPRMEPTPDRSRRNLLAPPAAGRNQ